MVDRSRLSDLDRALSEFFRRLRGEISHLLEQGLTGSQHAVLRLLASHPGLHVCGVADALGVTSSAASALCDRMVRDRLLDRRPDPCDRRRVVLNLTVHGRRLLERAEETRLLVFNRYFASLPTEDLDRLIGIFSRLAEVVPGSHEPPR